jgi:signal transduction histidine kinase
LATFVVLAAVGVVLVVVNGEPVGEQVPFVIAFSMFGVVGALIISRERRNVIGALLLYGSFMTAVSFLAGELVTWLDARGSIGVLAQVAGILSGFGWLLGVFPVVFLLPLLFPDGHLPSPRWKPFLWFLASATLLLFASLVFGDPVLTGSSEAARVPNPLYVEAIGDRRLNDGVFAVVYFGSFAVAVASMFVRFRAASGVERQQIKWVGFGFLAAFVAAVVSSFIASGTLSAVVGGVGFLAFPASIGIAVLRFHLYDLDVVVRKTVLYAALGIFATAVYLAVVIGVGTWVGRDSSLLTMVAAVVVAVTFQPVRSQLTRLADRVVYGKRATPYEVLSEFSERVGGAYADDDVLPRMVRVLGEGVGAERADVWLAVDGEVRDVAAWPPGAALREPVPLGEGSVEAVAGDGRAFPVLHGGELLGVLTVGTPTSDPFTSADEKLVGDLAAQAGLVLRNVRLTEALRARLDDLRAAQKRLVAAQDEERRRLERNIHDGAQQQLVALAVKARLARGLTERDASKAAEMLTQIEAETQAALDDLRDLARGIYPPLLADKGLAAALEGQGRKSPVPVTVDADGVGRLPQEIEAAVYFSALEALQNTAKYAHASSATVTLRRSDGVLAFSVADDGTGFDPALTAHGTGLQGIADRLGALDGAVSVESTPGSGTTVTGRVPVRSGADEEEGKT